MRNNNISSNINLNTLGFSSASLIQKEELENLNLKLKLLDRSFYDLGLINSITSDTFKEFILKLETNKTYAILPVVIFENTTEYNKIFTLCKYQIITDNVDIDSLDAFLHGLIAKFSDSNYEEDIREARLGFRLREISIKENVYNKVNKYLINKANVNNQWIHHNKDLNKKHLTNKLYPNTIDLLDYGKLLDENYKYDNLIGKYYQYLENITIFVSTLAKGKAIKNETTRCCYVFKKGKFSFKYIDIFDDISNNFFRKIDNKLLNLDKKTGKILNFEHKIKCKPISKSKRDLIKDTKIVSFDIECYIDKNNNFIPYSTGVYDGTNFKVYYLKDYSNSYHMMSACLTYILNNYKNYTIYVHNLRKFDSFFLIQHYCNSQFITGIPFFKDKFFSLTMILKDENNKSISKVIFKDSYLLLNSSLEKLGKEFNVKTKKGIFPYFFINADNLNYKGHIPDISYFNKDVSVSEYLNYKEDYINLDWSIREATLKYIQLDLESLYQIITAYRDEIFLLENINITKILTTSSLVVKIFTSNFLSPYHSIYNIRGETAKNIRQAFFGGRVDVFKCSVKNLNCYDINSLYSYIMSIKDFPVGEPTLSYDQNLDNYFGFVYCSIETPIKLDKPVLPFRDKEGNIYNPLGNWDGMYFSEEVKEAVKEYNYKIKVHYGYKFERGTQLFTEFVNKYHELKKYARHLGLDSKVFTAKAILNSLFGRFGIKDTHYIINILKKNEAKDIFLKHEVSEHFNISDTHDYIKYTSNVSTLFREINGMDAFINEINNMDMIKHDIDSSLPIAVAVTAYARMYMNTFINNSDLNVYYTDTDSIFTDKKLSSSIELGMFKKENKSLIKEAFFIAPKLYCLVLENGDIIIKARTIGDENLNYQDFIEMSYGCSVTKKKVMFQGGLSKGNISLNVVPITITPLNKKRLTNKSLTGQFYNTTPLKVVNGKIQQIVRDNYNLILYYKKPTSLIPYGKFN